MVVPHGDRHHGELYAYTGAGIDAETNGLYDLRARMYSPVLGRFLQADPIGTQGGMNLYAYGPNSGIPNTEVAPASPAGSNLGGSNTAETGPVKVTRFHGVE